MTTPDPNALPILKIALTGGIAAGKSLIRTFMETEGLPVVDADDVVHDLLANDEELKRQIHEAFGPDVFYRDGTVNRKALGDVVFAEPDWRRLLESWIHPKTRLAIAGFFQRQAESGEPMAVAVIPLLFESGLAELYDVVWLVRATPEQQVERLMLSRKLTEPEARLRVANQLSFDEKYQRLQSCPNAAVLDNTGSAEETATQVRKLIALLKSP